jgi:hypothetical protein
LECLVEASAQHAARRVAEMRTAAPMLEELGVEPRSGVAEAGCGRWATTAGRR